MLSLKELAIELKARADPTCSLCGGNGQYLRLDKALVQCNCIESLIAFPPTKDDAA